MRLTPFYVVISFFAVAVMIPRAWCLLRSTLSKVDATLSRCGLVCIALVTDFFHDHVEITHDVWHSVSVYSDLATDLHNLDSQSATPKQKRICLPKIDDELVNHIAQQVSDMHREYDRDPVAYQQKMFADFPSAQRPEQALTAAQEYTGTVSHNFASAPVYQTPQTRSFMPSLSDLSYVFARPSEDNQPDECVEWLNEMVAAQTQLSSLCESVEGLVNTIEQSLPYRI